MSKITTTALLGRGIDASTADRLVLQGYTINKLKSANSSELAQLGLTQDQIIRIQGGSRPPIPAQTVHSLLYKAAFTCSVCRRKDNPIIIHHIQDWAKTRNHDESNLVVLCLNCHSQAHSVNAIALNLTEEKLQAFKSKWEHEVRKRETDALFTKSSWGIGNGVWDYFNHNRIIDITKGLNIDLGAVSGFQPLCNKGVISNQGAYIWPASVRLSEKENIRFIYDGSLPAFDASLRRYYADLVKRILEETDWLDISSTFKKSTANMIRANSIITVTGSFRFKNLRSANTGPGQTIKGYKKGHGLQVQFSIDAWETTSPSAHSVNLSGLWRSTCILLVRGINVSKQQTIIDSTCLAIGTGFTDYIAPAPQIAYRDD
jgi:hypothetical protein